MTKLPSLYSISHAWLRDGPVSPHVPAYVSRSFNYENCTSALETIATRESTRSPVPKLP